MMKSLLNPAPAKRQHAWTRQRTYTKDMAVKRAIHIGHKWRATEEKMRLIEAREKEFDKGEQ